MPRNIKPTVKLQRQMAIFDGSAVTLARSNPHIKPSYLLNTHKQNRCHLIKAFVQIISSIFTLYLNMFIVPVYSK